MEIIDILDAYCVIDFAVPGCDRPIEKMKEYYKRYKICPYHMEANFLLVEGQKIRFCQQCGRFQLLSEFDGEKRSCRKRLARHNRRRRKSEADGGRISREDQGPSRENDDKATPNPLNNTAHGLVNSALENVLEAMRVDGLFETPNAAEVKVRALVALVELQQALEELSHDRSQSQSQDTHGRQSLPPDTLKHTMAKLLQQKQVPVLKTSAMGPPPIQQLGFPGFSKAPPLNSQAVDAQISAHLMQNFPPLNPAQLMHFQQQAAMAQSLASPMSARCGDSKQGIPPHDGTCPSESFPDKLNILLETLKQASNK